MKVARFIGVTKIYDLGKVSVPALREVDLDFDEGDFVAIMGASGSGKSTLLNLIGCLDRPTEGQYILGDEDISLLDDDALSEIRSRRIGFIFQSYNLIAQLTVLENVEIPLFYQDCPPHESRSRALEVIGQVGLEPRIGHRPSELSGGEQQRVAIARALVTSPLILLADEPTGNLDSKTGQDILNLLTRLNEDGKTIIMVTHDDKVASRAKRIVRLADGKVVSSQPRPSAPSSEVLS